MNWQAEIEARRFVIEHEVKRPVTGNVAYVSEWVRWGAYYTASERDRELVRLRERARLDENYRARDIGLWENRRVAY